jgi:hypothetical protein
VLGKTMTDKELMRVIEDRDDDEKSITRNF